MFFTVNYNKFGPRSSIKLDQLTKLGIQRNIDRVVIRSTNALCKTCNKNLMENRFKIIKII